MPRLLLLLAAALLCAPLCRAQASPPAPQMPGVHLEVKGGRSSFAIGETIELELVFTGEAPDLHLNTTDYGDMAEDVTVTPAEGWYRTRTASHHDYSNTEKLTGSPIRVPVLLNDGIVFQKPGRYTIAVATFRLSGAGLDHPLPAANTVSFDITAPDEKLEAERVRLLSSRIAAGDTWERVKVAKELGFLGGDDAIRAKVRWLQVEDDNNISNFYWDLLSGFTSSRNLPLQLSLLEAAWRDPTHPPNPWVLTAMEQTRAAQRHKTEPGWQMVLAAPADDPEIRAVNAQHQADLHAIVLSLPARSGENRTHTAYYLMQAGDTLPADKAIVRSTALEEFAHMDEIEQSMLIETRWKDVKDAALVPHLEAMLANTDAKSNHNDPAQRLIELDPEAARRYVVRDICDPHRSPSFIHYSSLPDSTLPAIDACMAAQLHSWADPAQVPGSRSTMHTRMDDQKVMLAARYGSEALLPAMEAAYAAARGVVAKQYEGPFLAYLLRYKPKEAVAMIQQTDPAFEGTAYDIDQVYQARKALYPPELTAWLEKRLADGSDEQARALAFHLAALGSNDERKPIEERLAKLRTQWAGRVAEIEHADFNTPAGMARLADRDLTAVFLRYDTRYPPGPGELQSLKAGCLSQECRKQFP